MKGLPRLDPASHDNDFGRINCDAPLVEKLMV
jgi:hypothetical protein